jgi:fermentation-respiration switch protein FrsA (DUF1100 family)
VLEGAFPTLPEFWRHYPVAHAVLRLSQAVVPSIERGLRPELEATRVVGQPAVLLIYSEGDRYTPPEHGQRLLRAFSGSASAEICIVPGADHTYAYRDAADAYRQRVMPFLGKAMQHRGSP